MKVPSYSSAVGANDLKSECLSDLFYIKIN